MAEAYMNHTGQNWRAWSAGSKPTGTPNPFAIETLIAHNISPLSGDGEEPSSQSWDIYAGSNAPIFDVVVTVCDNAAGETCPIWPTNGGTAPQKLHWSFPDPAATTGGDDVKRASFETIFADIRSRIDSFLATQP